MIGVEGGGPFASLGRSPPRPGPLLPVLGVALLMGLVELAAGPGAQRPAAGPRRLGRAGTGWPLLAVGDIAAEVIVVPFVAAATVLLYLDLRVRTEGLDIEMAAGRVLDRAA